MLERFENFTQAISRAYKQIGRIKSNYMSNFELKGSTAMCIFFLGKHENGLKPSELCELCQEDKGAISKTLKDLVKHGIVYSDATLLKKYRARYKITEEGKKVYDQVCETADKIVATCTDGISDEDREAFYRVLNHITSNLDKMAKAHTKG